MNNQQIEQQIIDFYNNHELNIRRDDKEKLHNLVKDHPRINDYATITQGISYLELIKEERVK